MYIAMFHSGDRGVLLALGRPDYASCRLPFGLRPGGETAQPLVQLPSVCIGP